MMKDTPLRYDIGIAGMWISSNYGALLTTFGLYSQMIRFGWKPVLIDHSSLSPDLHHFRETATILEDFLKQTGMDVIPYREELKSELNDRIDRFVVGSDQVWNCEYTGSLAPYYLLDFADEGKTKVSYASSMGHHLDKTPKSVRDVISSYLKRFSGISVREDVAVSLLRNGYNIEAVHNLDPVFLGTPDVYNALTSGSGPADHESYIATYIMDPDENVRNALLYSSSRLGYPLINMVSTQDGAEEKIRQLNLGNTYGNVSVADWLTCIKNSRFVITDSFHGTCFAIIFGKPFICIANKSRGLSRFTSLLHSLHLNERLVMDPGEVESRSDLFDPVDYTAVNDTIDRLRDQSAEWLKTHLMPEHGSSPEPLSRRHGSAYYAWTGLKLALLHHCYRVLFRITKGKLKKTMENARNRYFSYRCLLDSYLEQSRNHQNRPNINHD